MFHRSSQKPKKNMFKHIPYITQNKIIKNINLFIDAAIEANIKIELYKLTPDGTCNGLTYLYEYYSHVDLREDFVLTLMLFATLDTPQKRESLLEKYDEDKNLILNVNEQFISFNKIIVILQGIHFSQTNASLKEIGVLWDRTYTFICSKQNLSSHLDLINNGSVLINLGRHIFTIQKTQEGTYLFDANHIDKMAITPALISNQELADIIIKNCHPFIADNDNVAFTMCFVSYPSKSKKLLEEAVEELGNDLLAKCPEIESLIHDYREKKLSRLDCALAIQTLFSKENIESEKFTQFKKEISNLISNEKEMINKQFSYNEDSISQKAYIFNINVLWLAVTSNQIKFVKSLLQQMHDEVNLSIAGLSPLIIAVKRKHKQIVKLLLSHPKIQVNQSTDTGFTPLYIAAESNDLDLVKLLLKHPDILVNQSCYDSFTPLITASTRGYVEIVEALLKHPDILINQANNFGYTALAVATHKGHIDVVNVLINAGAETNVKVQMNISILIDHAKINNRFREVKKLLRQTFNKNIPTSLSDFTPLHAAIFYGHEKVVKALLEANADIHADASGISCLNLAEAMGHKIIINLLQEHLSKQNSHSQNTNSRMTP